jgi:hypothetical protein
MSVRGGLTLRGVCQLLSSEGEAEMVDSLRALKQVCKSSSLCDLRPAFYCTF